MKLKSFISALTLLAASAVSSNAATFFISNANDGATDTLYANSANALMNGGVVALGYFSAGVTPSQIDTIAELRAHLSDFTIVTSIAPGSPSGTLGGSFAGYADQFGTPPTSIGQINVGNALLNRVIYSIVTDASSLTNPAASAEFALFQSGVLTGDTPNEIAILGSPAGATPIIGSLGTITGNFGGQGSSTFTTIQMAPAIPEPSAAILGAVGALALLRRRRH